MEIVFKSFDGRVFKTKKECENHERKIISEEQNVKLVSNIQRQVNDLNSLLEVYKSRTGLWPSCITHEGRLLLHFSERK